MRNFKLFMVESFMLLAGLVLPGVGSAASTSPSFTFHRAFDGCVDQGHNRGLNSGYVGECGDLSNADLTHKDFSNQNFQGANLSDADLGHSIFRGANFCGADLTEANLAQDADFKGAIYCDQTKFSVPNDEVVQLGFQYLNYASIDSQLLAAVDAKNIDQVQNLLNEQGDPNTVLLAPGPSPQFNICRYPALVRAAGTGSLPLVQLLFNNGAKLVNAGCVTQLPQDLTVTHGYDILGTFDDLPELPNGVEWESAIIGSNDLTVIPVSPLPIVAAAGFLDITQFLVENGADPALGLKYAASRSQVDIVNYLLSKKISAQAVNSAFVGIFSDLTSISTPGDDGSSGLQIVEALLSHGADANSPIEDFRAPGLHYSPLQELVVALASPPLASDDALMQTGAKLIGDLVAAGADVHIKAAAEFYDGEGDTTFTDAAHGNVDGRNLLMLAMRPSIPGWSSCTHLEPVIAALIKAGVDPKEVASDGLDAKDYSTKFTTPCTNPNMISIGKVYQDLGY